MTERRAHIIPLQAVNLAGILGLPPTTRIAGVRWAVDSATAYIVVEDPAFPVTDPATEATIRTLAEIHKEVDEALSSTYDPSTSVEDITGGVHVDLTGTTGDPR